MRKWINDGAASFLLLD